MATRLMASERRRAPRIPGRVSLAVTDGGAEVQAETKDLSASGAYCLMDRFLAPMSKLQLRFELPRARSGRTTVRCAGVVVRVEPVVSEADRGRYHIAIFFTELSERDRSVISRYVQQRLSASPPTH
jgi:hypothetical protein